MPAVSLRCRICEYEHALEAVGVCSACFGPLAPVYDKDALRETLTRESIEAGPASIWRYAPLLPVEAPRKPRLAPGFTPLLPAPRLAAQLGLGELYLKLDIANPTHSFKDRVVAVACAKALELGATTLACSSTGNLANAVAARAAAEGMEAIVLSLRISSPRSSRRRLSTARPSTPSMEATTIALASPLSFRSSSTGRSSMLDFARTTRKGRRRWRSRSPSSSDGGCRRLSLARSHRGLSTRRCTRASLSFAISGS